MRGAFGRADWIVNGAIFAFYPLGGAGGSGLPPALLFRIMH
jgi:hypothetical protein